MSIVRVAMEWNYKDLEQVRTRNAFSRLFSVRRFPVGLPYISSTLLLNFKTCIEKGRHISSRFNGIEPSFSDYMNM